METNAAGSTPETRPFTAEVPVHGLTSPEARRRYHAHGPNRLARSERASWPRVLARQFASPLVLILVGAAVVAALLGEALDAIAIGAIIIINAVIGFVQETRAERALDALRKMARGTARVIRDGFTANIPIDAVVPGDLLQLEAGMIVPADAQVLDADGLKVNEAPLTGESESVSKGPGADHDRVYRATEVTHGVALALVTETGMDTKIGRVASLLHHTQAERSPLERHLARLGRMLLIVVLGVAALVTGLGLLQGRDPLLMVLVGISLAVAAIPEALPAVATVALAFGAKNLVRRHVLVRRLSAVEALGSVTTICADKTGTLTQNRMHVEHIDVSEASRERLLDIMALNHDVDIDVHGIPIGDPTEVALYEAAARAGAETRERLRALPVIRTYPFDAERKMMSTVHRAPGGLEIALVKGAPETVLPRCVRRFDAKPFDREEELSRSQHLAADGMRVLAFATRTLSGNTGVERELELVGFVGLLDPPRPEATESVRRCKSAGIRPVMITGDHPATARAIAKRVGIASEHVLIGAELDSASSAQVCKTDVFARVAPEQKIAIVNALKSEGAIVAMTGDGVNDAPALKAADIGVAMGATGTDVAREASSLVLLDDNFASIVAAVEGGRRVFDNIRKFVRFALAGNSGEILTLLVAGLLGMPLPLLPIHILWVNLVTDGLPGLALTWEPAEHDVMSRPPHPPRTSIADRGVWLYAVLVGSVLAALALVVHGWAVQHANPRDQTLVFTILATSQMALILSARRNRILLSRGHGSHNFVLLGAVVLTIALQAAVLYLPVANRVLHTVPLPPAELLLCAGAGVVMFAASEIVKAVLHLSVSEPRS